MSLLSKSAKLSYGKTASNHEQPRQKETLRAQHDSGSIYWNCKRGRDIAGVV